MRQLATLVTTLVIAVAPSPALATKPAALTMSDVYVGLIAGWKHWGAFPACLSVRVQPIPDHKSAWSFPDCHIGIDPQTFREHTPAYMCALMVHEVGHQLGLGHSTDPNNIMNPNLAKVPECPGRMR